MPVSCVVQGSAQVVLKRPIGVNHHLPPELCHLNPGGASNQKPSDSQHRFPKGNTDRILSDCPQQLRAAGSHLVALCSATLN